MKPRGSRIGGSARAGGARWEKALALALLVQLVFLVPIGTLLHERQAHGDSGAHGDCAVCDLARSPTIAPAVPPPLPGRVNEFVEFVRSAREATLSVARGGTHPARGPPAV